jgi:galactokinase
VELLGNHTDYNQGLVLSAAIDRETVVTGRSVEGNVAQVFSINLDREDKFDPTHPTKSVAGDWAQYVRGVVWALGQTYGKPECGFRVVVAGNVPLGAGLSSSASLQGAMAMYLLGARVIPGTSPILDDEACMKLAKTLQRSENEFVGVASGILDQFSVLFGRANHALMLDCRSLTYDRVSLGNPAPAIVVCDSMTSRKLADGMYNVRRSECERVLAFYQAKMGKNSVSSLRDISLQQIQSDWNNLDSIGRKRARHVLSENDRVRRGVDALQGGDLVAFGRMMSASHRSSRDDFENSSRAIDILIECAESAPGYLGGKLSGAGWAGCTVNLVRSEMATAFAESVKSDYKRRMNVVPQIHICKAAEGASCSGD